MRCLGLFLLLVSLPLAEAQTRGAVRKPASKPAAGKPSPGASSPTTASQATFLIDSIQVTGNRIFTKEQVLRAAQLQVGDPGGKPLFDAARDRLLASGAFESAGYRFSPSPQGGYQVVFELVEVEQVFPVRLDGLGEDTTELRSYLQKTEPLFGEQLPGTDKLLRQIAGSIEKYLASKGSKERVVGRVLADAPEKLVVVFRPARPLPTVAEVKFKGNEVIGATALQNRIAVVAVGTVYTEKNFRQILDANIRPLYEARGRLQVKFTQLETEPAKDVKGLVVTVTVDEGAVYTLGKVDVVGDGIDSEDLLRVAKFQPESVANFDEINEAVERMKRRLRRDGYLDVKANVERRLDEEKRLVDLTVVMEAGNQYTLGELKIVGLDLLAEAAVRKLWGIQPGKPFNVTYPDFFLEQLRERGMFENLGKTKAEVTPDAESRRVDVTLFFEAPAPPPGRRP